MGRPTLSPEHVEAWRAHACEVALELLTRESAELSLRRLGQALGCSHATPYRYFESREELFMEVRALCFRRFGAFVQGRIQDHRDGPSNVLAAARAYADYAQERPTEFRLMFELGQPDPDRFPRAYEVGMAAWAIVETLVADAIEAGELQGDARTVAHELWAAVHGVVSLQAAGRLHHLEAGPKPQDLVTSITRSLLRAHAT